METKIYPSIATTRGANWRQRIKEAKELKITEVCAFPTCLDAEQRKKFHQLLEDAGIKSIPLYHLRSDSEVWELEYLEKNFQIGVYNTHNSERFPITIDYGDYRKKIYIENSSALLDNGKITGFAGICIDYSHLENDRFLYKDRYEHNIKIIDDHQCGCGHLSAIREKPFYAPDLKEMCYDAHSFKDLSEFDFLKRYLPKYHPPILALELENTLTEQLKAREYILKMIE